MRPNLRRTVFLALIALTPALRGAESPGITLTTGSTGGLADEPIDIGTTPQLFIDDYLVDNRYPVKQAGKGRENVLRTFHTPVKHEANPLISRPMEYASYPAVRYDADAKLYRLWYQWAMSTDAFVDRGKKAGSPGFTCFRYAESADGIHWTLPSLGLYDFQGSKDNNIFFAHPDLKKGKRVSSFRLLNEDAMPAKDMHGYKYLMTYTLRSGTKDAEGGEVYLMGTTDGVHWDQKNQVSIGMTGISDGWFGADYDALRKTYVGFARPRDRYQTHGAAEDAVYDGVVRRIARVQSDELWTRWSATPRTIFLPDEQDQVDQVSTHMAWTGQFYAGVYFGFFVNCNAKEKEWTELTLSRDGRNFERVRRQLIPNGPEGAWDSNRLWIGDFIDVGDEWWVYYRGSSGLPNVPLPKGGFDGIGLAKIRREGFVSMRGPARGGVLVTRLLKWPGGDLLINCDMSASKEGMTVRVCDEKRDGIDGFDYKACAPITGDSTAHKVVWAGQSMDNLKGREVRLEFFFKGGGDLYSFRATER